MPLRTYGSPFWSTSWLPSTLKWPWLATGWASIDMLVIRVVRTSKRLRIILIIKVLSCVDYWKQGVISVISTDPDPKLLCTETFGITECSEKDMTKNSRIWISLIIISFWLVPDFTKIINCMHFSTLIGFCGLQFLPVLCRKNIGCENNGWDPVDIERCINNYADQEDKI